MADNAPDRAARAREWGARAASYAAYAVPKNRPYARDLVTFVGLAGTERVLDVATGPGVVAIEAALVLSGGGEVVATDLSPDWEPFVAQAAVDAGVANVRFEVMAAEALALPDASFDAAFCQFGLMFVPDPAAALAEIRRVLRPGGRLGAAVWSTPDKVAHFGAQRALVTALGNPPEFSGPSPMALGEPGLIERLVAGAGFVDIVVQPVTHTVFVDDPDEEWHRLSRDPRFANLLGQLNEQRRDEIRRQVLAAIAPYRTGDVIQLPSEAIVVTARKADGSTSGNHELTTKRPVPLGGRGLFGW